MSTETTTTNEVTLALPADITAQELSDLIKKFNGWSPLIIDLYRTELSLKAQALEQAEKVKLPTNIEEIPVAEQHYIELGKLATSMTERRLTAFSPLGKLGTRLMEPENQVKDLRKKLADAMVPIKSEHAKKEAGKKAKEAEVQSIIGAIKQHLVNIDHEYKSLISMRCTAALQNALDNDLSPDDIQAYVVEVTKGLGPADFQAERPDVKLIQVDPTEAEELFNTHFLCNAHAYHNMFKMAVFERFSDYAVAFANKAESLKLAAEEQAKKEADLQTEKDQKALAAKMETAASGMTSSGSGGWAAPIKDLKKTYEVDMPDTLDNAILIISAFVANRQLCEPFLATKKYLTGFTADSCAKALAKAKNADEKFQPKGITFKLIEKQ